MSTDKFAGHVRPLSVDTGICSKPKDFDWITKNIPCQAACPAQTDIPGYLEAISRGDYAGAYAINLRDNIFPGVLGRVCTRPCESACRHGWEGLGEPVAICHSKRSSSDYTKDQNAVTMEKLYGDTGKSVGIIGAGVAGLTCARNLTLLGHKTVVYESHERPGGMLLQGLPEFRLPRDVVDNDIKKITELGVEIKCSVRIGTDVSLDELLGKHDAVIVAAGTLSVSLPTNIKDVEGPGVEHGLTFLRSVNEEGRTELEGPVIVIGGGFTAIDCARTALRLGAGKPEVYYRRSVSVIRVTPGEIEEMSQEGMDVIGNARPERVLRDDQGNVRGLLLVRTKTIAVDGDPMGRIEDIPGSEFEVECRTILMATGQGQDRSFMSSDPNSLFIAGDYATGASNLIQAIGHAKRIVEAVDVFLMNEKRTQDFVAVEDGRSQPRTRDMDEWPVNEIPVLSVDKRSHKAEVELGLSDSTSQKEASRCYLCHYKYEIDIDKCIYCDQCVEVKPRPNCIVKVTSVNTNEQGVINGWDVAKPDLKETPKPFFYFINQEDCIRCNACLEVCPTRCISVQKVSMQTSAACPVAKID